MASFYADENFPRRTVEALRVLDHDVLTTQDAGNAGQALPDHEVLDFAYKAGIRDFDTARSYGRGEEFLGEWLRSRNPTDVVISSTGAPWETTGQAT